MKTPVHCVLALSVRIAVLAPAFAAQGQPLLLRPSEPLSDLPDFEQLRRIRLVPVPDIKPLPAPEPAPSDDEIDALIASLAGIDSPDIGLSPTMTGEAFAPLNNMDRGFAGLLGGGSWMSRHPALRRLVEMGPAALPHLLRALDDPTPTKLRVLPPGRSSGMILLGEALIYNRAHPRESPVLGVHPAPGPGEPHFDPNSAIDSYTVKVGDVCFVIIGQILGRPYSAVRYQPTLMIVVNSPVETPSLAADLRKMWSSDQPRDMLLGSLLVDFSSRGIPAGRSLDWMQAASTFQAGAATRLLYYFPRESSALVTERLARLDVSDVRRSSSGEAGADEHGAGLKLSSERETANEVCTKDFISAVAWSREPAVLRALRSLRARSQDPEIVSLLNQYDIQPEAK